MADLELLDAADAAVGLREAGDAARGFLGMDPVTQNDLLLTSELTRLDALVFRRADTLVGAMPNERQPRQAYVAGTSADGEALRALLDFLATYRRCTSFVSLVPADSPVVPALAGCGFTERGTLRAHRYGSGAYRDVLVHFARLEDVRCS
jgi:hypothetical protein